jgi:hypothetical protein
MKLEIIKPLLALALSEIISGVQSQSSCDSTKAYYHCCLAVKSWQSMGKSIPTGISASDNSCCTKPMSGITCDTTKTKVTKINWKAKNLLNSISTQLAKLTSLTQL